MDPWRRGPSSCLRPARAVARFSRCFNTLSALRAATPRPRSQPHPSRGIHGSLPPKQGLQIHFQGHLSRFHGLLLHNQGRETQPKPNVSEPKSEEKNTANAIQAKTQRRTAAKTAVCHVQSAVNKHLPRLACFKIRIDKCKIPNKKSLHSRTNVEEMRNFTHLHISFLPTRLSLFFGKSEKAAAGLRWEIHHIKTQFIASHPLERPNSRRHHEGDGPKGVELFYNRG